MLHCSQVKGVLPSGEAVLNGVGQSVAQVKRSRHVGRRDAHHEHSPGVGLPDALPLHNQDTDLSPFNGFPFHSSAARHTGDMHRITQRGGHQG